MAENNNNAENLSQSESASIFMGAIVDGSITGKTFNLFNLDGARIENLTFKSVTFSGSYVGLDFANCKFKDTLFTDGSFTNATFRNVSMENVKVLNSDFKETTFLESDISTLLAQNCDFEKSAFFNVNMEGDIRFNSSNLSETFFTECSFGNSTFENTSLSYAIVRASSFDSFNLISAIAINFQGERLRIPRFKALKSNLSSSNFIGSYLLGAVFQDSDISNSFFEETTLTEAVLTNILAQRACFVGADLERSNLDGLIASYSDFSHAMFFGASLKRADFKGANFHRAKGIDLATSGAKTFEEAKGTDPQLEKAEDFIPFIKR
jgi:uncharacterized protein YjbI with pentapeptide repeats